MVNLFNYDYGGYSCAENIILTVIMLFLFYILAQKQIIIMKDRNQILDKMDKWITFLSLLQILLLLIYFFIAYNNLFLSLVRCLNMSCNLIIILIFVNLLFENKDIKGYCQKGFAGGIAYVFVLWFFVGFFHKDAYTYNCLKIDWVLLSASSLIMSSIQFYSGILVYQQISENKPEENAGGLNAISSDELKNHLCRIIGLMVSFFFPSLVQFVWDYLAYINFFGFPGCVSYYDSSSVFSLVLFIILKIFTLVVPNLGIYWVFYWRNRKKFKTLNENFERNFDLFADTRSELIEATEITTNQG